MAASTESTAWCVLILGPPSLDIVLVGMGGERKPLHILIIWLNCIVRTKVKKKNLLHVIPNLTFISFYEAQNVIQ